MGRNIFLFILTLIAGICIGVLVMLVFVEPAPPVSHPDTLRSTSVVSPSPSTSPAPDSPDQFVMTATPVPEQEPYDNRALLSLAFDVASALERRDYQTLSTYVHPSEGVLFTPYSTVDLTANLSFTPYQLAKFGSDSTKYVWGISDGKGEPLELTVSEGYAPDKWLVLLQAAIILLVSIRLFYDGRRGVGYIREILQPMKEEKPFDSVVSTNLRKLAKLSIYLGVCYNIIILTEQIMNVFVYDLPGLLISEKIIHVGGLFSVDLTFLIYWAILLLLSYVFRYGEGLQQLSDETL